MQKLIITADMAEVLAQFDAAGVGTLTLAMMTYIQTGEEPQLTGDIRFGWIPLRQALDAQAAEHDRKAAAGRQGGRPKKAEAVEKPVENLPMISTEMQKKADESRKKQEKAEVFPVSSRASNNNIISLHQRDVKAVSNDQRAYQSTMQSCPSLYQSWWREIDPEERQLERLCTWWLRFSGQYNREQLDCAFGVVERKAVAGTVRDPFAYMISMLMDWQHRGLRKRGQIEQYLDVPPPEIRKAAEA